MRTNSDITCPRCSLAKQVYKVSRIYLEGLAYIHHKKSDQFPNLECLLHENFNENQNQKHVKNFVVQLVELIKPPSSNTKVIRLIHPDHMALFLSIVSVIMIFNAWRSQSSSFPGLLVISGLVVLLFITFRKKVTQKYEERKLQELADVAKIEQGVSRWMKIFYCAQDQIFFVPETDQILRPDEIRSYIING